MSLWHGVIGGVSNMPYVSRDARQHIIAVYAEPRADATEWLDDGDPQLLEDMAQMRDLLCSLDSDMVRVIEDLIDVLVEKRLILPTDLPEAAQRKLLGRQLLRQRLSGANPVVDENDII